MNESKNNHFSKVIECGSLLQMAYCESFTALLVVKGMQKSHKFPSPIHSLYGYKYSNDIIGGGLKQKVPHRYLKV